MYLGVGVHRQASIVTHSYLQLELFFVNTIPEYVIVPRDGILIISSNCNPPPILGVVPVLTVDFLADFFVVGGAYIMYLLTGAFLTLIRLQIAVIESIGHFCYYVYYVGSGIKTNLLLVVNGLHLIFN
jgi:hypothetical protein